MKDNDILEVVQARIDGKQLEKQKVQNTEWQNVNQTEALNFEDYVYRVKNEDGLPKTWYDYCHQNSKPISYLEAQMPWIGNIRQNGVCPETHSYSHAFIALAKLVMLRDYYNNYQTPSHSGTIHAITVRNKNGKLVVVPLVSKSFSNEYNFRPYFLHFHTPQLRDTFMENFNDLILEAAELLV